MRDACTSEEGCEAPQVGRGLCRRHYMREYAREHRPVPVPPAELRCTRCTKVYTPKRAPHGEVHFCSKECKDAFRLESGRMGVAARKYYFKSKYGLTVEEIDAMAAKGCAICGTTEWMGRHGGRPHIDHNHETGEVRGLLCHNHNLMIGYAHEDIAVLKAAIRYLSRVA